MTIIPDHNVLNFSTNWNNKLDCQAFTTIRLDNEKYNPGTLHSIRLKGKQYKRKLFQVVAKKVFLLADINEYTARIDTAYSAEECKEIIRTMYKHRAIKWERQRLCMPLLVETKIELEQQLTMTL